MVITLSILSTHGGKLYQIGPVHNLVRVNVCRIKNVRWATVRLHGTMPPNGIHSAFIKLTDVRTEFSLV